MSRDIDSEALRNVGKVLGMAGSGQASQQTDLEDGAVTQTLPINEFVRRSLTLGQSTGVYMCSMINEHTAAGSLNNAIDPYEPGGLSGGVWPNEVTEGRFDAWLLGASANVQQGSVSDIDVLSLEIDSTLFAQRGWTRVDDGTEMTVFVFTQIARWVQADFAAGRNKGTWRPLRIRWPRGSPLNWFTDSTLAGNADFSVNMLWGLFPAGLGQDGLV